MASLTGGRRQAAALGARVPLPQASRGVLLALAAGPVVLGLSRLLPPEGVGLALRLAGASVCVLVLPGALLLRALGWPREPGVAAAASLGLSLAILFLGLGLVFAAGASLSLAIVVLAVFMLAALVPAAVAAGPPRPVRAEGLALAGVLAAAVLFAGVVWWAAGPPEGDALFHLARVRKLAELDALSSLGAVNEFQDGGLHPGYAFPLWHAALALVARLGGVDSTAVVVHMASVLVPLSFLVSYGTGAALFRSWAGGVAVLAAQVAQVGFARAGIGSFDFLALPATVSRLLLVPAVLALAFSFVGGGGLPVLLALAAASLALAVVHPTYALYAALLLASFLLARAMLGFRDRGGLARIGAALGAVLVPTGLFLVWLLPIVRTTASYRPDAGERAHGFEHYAGQIVGSADSFHFAAGALTRAGPAVVVGLVAVPLAALAWRRLWAAFVLGATLVLLATLFAAPLFGLLSDLVSLSQSRRLALFLPIPFALAGAALLVARLRIAGVVLAGVAGLAAELAYSGEFTYRVQEAGPAWPVWIALVGGLAALLVGVLLSRRGWELASGSPVWGAAAVLAFVLPLGVAGLSGLERDSQADPYALTTGVVEALRALPAGDVVFSDLETSYRAAAYAPVYVAAAPPAHVADTARNRPDARRRDVVRFFYRESETDAERRAILARYSAAWLLVDTSRPYPQKLVSGLETAYRDGRYELLQVSDE